MAFKIIFTENGLRTRNNCIDYVLSVFKNKFAAKSLYNDIENTIKNLEDFANSYQVCENKNLKKREIRKIHLKRHKYKIFYRIENEKEVHIDAILHDKQDFENILK